MNTKAYQFNHRSHMNKNKPAFSFYEDKVIQGLLKKSGHYVPPAAKASEGDEAKIIGNNRMTNPWDVDSLQAFLTLKCPECDFCTDVETLFQAHAVANHPLSLSNLLKRIDNFSGAALKGDNNFSLQGIS